MSVALDLLIFLAIGAGLVLVAVKLATAGDAVAEASGIGRIWIGTVLVAGATSLPELVTDVAAVRLEAPNIAAGDLFGSTMANMLILAIIDLASRERRVMIAVALDHVIAAALAIVMTCVAGALILTRASGTWGGAHPGSWLLALLYIAGSRAIYRHGRRAAAPASEASVRGRVPWRPLGRFGASALGVLALALRSPGPPSVWPRRPASAGPSSAPRSSASRRPSLSWSHPWRRCASAHRTWPSGTCSGPAPST